MKRLTPYAFLIVLAGLGWAAAFAAIGIGLFARVTDFVPVAFVFGLFGFIGGAAATGLRLAFEHQMPLDLAAQLRGPAEATESVPETASPAASAFGA